MREMVKPGLVLFSITLIAAILLGFVHAITKEPIELQKELMRTKAMQELLPAAGEFKDTKTAGNDFVTGAYEGISASGELEGHIINIKSKGFGGDIIMFVAINTKGTVAGVKILEHSETPGLGANAENDAFLSQFTGSSGNAKVQAITSSTITTNAVTKGVNEALAYYKDNLKRR